MSGRRRGPPSSPWPAGGTSTWPASRPCVSALGWDVVRVVVSMGDPSLAAVTRQHPGVQTITVPVADPGRLPLAAARNAGAEAALEAGAELLVFLDVDCLPGDRLLPRYAQAARDDALLCGPVTYLPQGAVLGDCPSGAVLDALRRRMPRDRTRPTATSSPGTTSTCSGRCPSR